MSLAACVKLEKSRCRQIQVVLQQAGTGLRLCVPCQIAQGSARAYGQPHSPKATAALFSPPVRRPGAAQEVPAPVHRADLASGRRIASNFAFLSLAELVCRATSILVSFSLMRRLGVVGYGRIEFAFNVVFWLVLLVRDSSDVIVARELSRHPRLIRPLVDHVLAIKGLFSLVLFAGLAIRGLLDLARSRGLVGARLLRLMLFTTASGLDFVYRGTECMGLLAVSLSLRTFIYAVGVLAWVGDPSRIVWVPVWLAMGEATGIGLVWLHYLKTHRLPRPRLGLRVLSVIVRGAARFV